MLGCSVGTGVKKSKSRLVGVGSVDVGSVDVGSVDVGSVGFFFFFLYSGRVRENFDFQLIGGGEWRRIKFEIDAEGLNR